MNVRRVYRGIKSLPVGAGTVLTVVFLALVMALTVAADDPAPGRPSGVCDGACDRPVVELQGIAVTEPFDELVPMAYLPLVRGGSDDRIWDPRLDDLGVTLEPAAATPGEPYWRLVEARWADPAQAGGAHSIFIDVLDSAGERAMGQGVRVGWPEGSVTLTIDKPPNEEWGTNFPMYATLGSYDVRVNDLPSDRIYGLGLGTAQEPDVKHHTSFYLIFQQVVR